MFFTFLDTQPRKRSLKHGECLSNKEGPFSFYPYSSLRGPMFAGIDICHPHNLEERNSDLKQLFSPEYMICNNDVKDPQADTIGRPRNVYLIYSALASS
jgi:hypothetical protein